MDANSCLSAVHGCSSRGGGRMLSLLGSSSFGTTEPLKRAVGLLCLALLFAILIHLLKSSYLSPFQGGSHSAPVTLTAEENMVMALLIFVGAVGFVFRIGRTDYLLLSFVYLGLSLHYLKVIKFFEVVPSTGQNTGSNPIIPPNKTGRGFGPSNTAVPSLDGATIASPRNTTTTNVPPRNTTTTNVPTRNSTTTTGALPRTTPTPILVPLWLLREKRAPLLQTKLLPCQWPPASLWVSCASWVHSSIVFFHHFWSINEWRFHQLFSCPSFHRYSLQMSPIMVLPSP